MTRPTTSEPRWRWQGFLQRGSPLAVGCFLGAEILFLAAAHRYGGPPWTVLVMMALLVQIVVDFRIAPLVMLAPCMAWVGLYGVTGDREFFFPFAMYLATFVAVLASARGTRLGFLAGGSLVAAFLAIRGLQAASARVLTVEGIVAVAILAIAMAAHAAAGKGPVTSGAIVALASLAACAALVL